MMRTRAIVLVTLLLVSAGMLLGAGGDGATDGGSGGDGGGEATTSSTESVEDVMNRLEDDQEENPLIDPVRQPPREQQVPSIKVPIDPAVVGVAPGQKQPTLRKEGEFVLNRRGRLQRSANGISMVFHFEADEKHAPEPPMILMPCQMLQSMEELQKERGQEITFVLSGQVFVYRGANYLLPTMMKLAVPRGNMEP